MPPPTRQRGDPVHERPVGRRRRRTGDAPHAGSCRCPGGGNRQRLSARDRPARRAHRVPVQEPRHPRRPQRRRPRAARRGRSDRLAVLPRQGRGLPASRRRCPACRRGRAASRGRLGAAPADRPGRYDHPAPLDPPAARLRPGTVGPDHLDDRRRRTNPARGLRRGGRMGRPDLPLPRGFRPRLAAV